MQDFGTLRQGGKAALVARIKEHESMHDLDEDDKETEPEVKVNSRDLTWGDKMKIEPKSESDSEKMAEIPLVEETSKEDDNFHKPTDISVCSQEQNLKQNESKHDVKWNIKNLKREASILAQASKQEGKGG